MSTRTNKPRRQDLGLTPLAPRDCPEEKIVSRSRVPANWPVRSGTTADPRDYVSPRSWKDPQAAAAADIEKEKRELRASSHVQGIFHNNKKKFSSV